MSKQITWEQYLQIVGLLKLAYDHHDRIMEIEEAIAGIVDYNGDEYYYGHISDSVWSEKYTASTLLGKMDIEVVKVVDVDNERT